MRITLLMLLALVPGLLAAPVPKVRKKSELEALTGTWTSLRYNGVSESVKLTLTFSAEGIVKSETGEWTFTLDEEKKLKRMIWKDTKGNNDWDVVFELNGDCLMIGFVSKGGKIPEELLVGSVVGLYEMRRK